MSTKHEAKHYCTVHWHAEDNATPTVASALGTLATVVAGWPNSLRLNIEIKHFEHPSVGAMVQLEVWSTP